MFMKSKGVRDFRSHEPSYRAIGLLKRCQLSVARGEWCAEGEAFEPLTTDD
jgi:hypothetical protein